MSLMVASVLGYALGSVPFGLLLTRAFGAGDLRSIGSGNIGATNVLRTGRKGLAAATLLLDGGKGAAAVLIAGMLPAGQFADGAAGATWLALAGGAGAMVGHCFPVWLKFKGGKGVATMLGVALGLAWPVGLLCLLAWVGMFKLSRISSVGGMSAALAAPIGALALGHVAMVPVLAALAALVLYQHRENIARLRAGTEPKVGAKKG
ncbi:glycerol-3-phosphate 1-O-acyltransferase PlsY [Novosphingobium sediminicola]|uniref:Glycerol-3-phosphate acyltransferase n=1 Tax=Novosphingobium sediminicola TaxID=563162 RepID=A0A7W6CCV5_9SPHN|nr:glycerol-3-phosphate 1-O-acyltransferase PlsY [Novosphingobium sediminicola]MBB3953492.1 glycerol-3-phosphate acyltransferase PlsY [Novosphingobium sediminicola]